MNKKKLSVVVILCTIFSVVIMLFSDRINVINKFVAYKIESINSNIHNKINNMNNSSKNNLNSGNSPNSSNENKQNNKNEKNSNGVENVNTYINIGNYKSSNKDKTKQQIVEEKKVSLSHDDVFQNQDKNSKAPSNEKDEDKQSYIENSEQSQKGDGSLSKKEIPVFKIARGKVKDSITFLDKEKLLFVAGKLSAVDYEKINKYLQNGSDEDVKNTIKLIRERLSDKDYEKVREVVEKFINMDAVEQ